MADDQGVNCSMCTIPISRPSEGHPDLVEDGSRSTDLKRATTQSPKSNIQRRLIAVIIFLAILAAALVIAVAVLSFNSSKFSDTDLQPKICTSNQCVATAANLIKSLDLDVDPCEDFYEFTCGNWAANHPIPDFTIFDSVTSEMQLHLDQRIRNALEKDIHHSQPIPVTQAQMLFHSCLDTTAIENAGIKPILQILDHAGLPRQLALNDSAAFNASYSYPIMSEGIMSYQEPRMLNQSQEFRWMVPVVGCKRVLGIDTIIGFDVFPNPFNTSVNVLTVGEPRITSALPKNEVTNGKVHGEQFSRRWQELPNWSRIRNERRPWERSPRKWMRSKDPEIENFVSTDSWLLYMESIIMLLDLWDALKNETIDATVVVDYVTNYRSDSSSDSGKTDILKNYIRRIYDLKTNVSNLKSLEPLEEDVNIMSEFSSGKDVPLPYVEMHVDDLQRLTDEAAYSEKQNPNLLIDWKVFLNLMFESSNVSLDFEKDLIVVQDIDYLKETAKYLANTSPLDLEGLLWWEVIAEVAPHGNSLIKDLYNLHMEKVAGGMMSSSRVMYCSKVTNDMMGMAVSWLLASEELAMNISSKFDNNGFSNVLEDKRYRVESMWVDFRTEFSNFVSNLDWMDEETREATRNKVDAMRNYFGYPTWLMDTSELELYYEGLTVNITSYLKNLVTKVQMEELQSLRRLRADDNSERWLLDPTVVNALYSPQENAVFIPAGILQFPFYELGLEVLNYGAIGSVLGHELTHGFDNFGRHFDERELEAVVDQQHHQRVNGKKTLGENIADNGGLHEALAAFENYKRRIDERTELRLPGLEQYSEDQLLFIAFGSRHCEHGTAVYDLISILVDDHSPSRARVWGPVSNSEEFARAFNCPSGSPMNPADKCRIW